ncbi:MAG: cysteine--tRNA ligase [Treponema sp.]|nr:MAG: cysteine--tRNA ligase [Treponema sp.]
MGLRLYNSLGCSIQEFVPVSENKVGFYGCGPTVYNYAHIGNLRAYVFQDTLKRVLNFAGYDTTHVMNITDVGHLAGDEDDGEDKMLRSAKERGKSVLEIADFYSRAFFYDCERLNINRPDIVCKATDHIADMIELIKKIETNGHTYFSGGNLYYDISTFPAYGELANINLDDLKAGARIAIDENKKNPYDFVLWFTNSKFENHALLWDSPWGRGYPGWHIECSAMSMKYLGNRIDIHTGGIDHIRVHHTNEIAQSEGATGEKWVNYWLHNEFLVMEKGKMSKSAGDFLILDNLIQEGFDPLDYRFLLLGGHYRSQLAFSWAAMETAKNSRKSLLQRIARIVGNAGPSFLESVTELKNIKFTDAVSTMKTNAGKEYIQKFFDALKDDLSTPKAISVLQVAIKDKNMQENEILTFIAICDSVLGLNLIETAVSIAKNEDTVDPEIDALVELRNEAKLNKNYQLADDIRDKLKARGIVLEDSPNGTKWKKI